MDQPTQTPSKLDRVREWAIAHKKLLIICGAVFIVLIGSAAAFALSYQAPVKVQPRKVVEKPKPAPEPVKYFSPLTGLEVPDEATTKRQVTAIMLENSPSARPQSGIKDAGVVYEAIAEGGITRFLTLFQEARPGLIGPVRSLRPYYVDWLASYDAAVAHAGGSKKALDEVRNGSYKDIDQFFNAKAYWRAKDRAAPHNVYTDFTRLDELNKSKGNTASNFVGFTRKADAPSAAPNAVLIQVNISSALYNSSYNYKADSNSYERSLGGALHTDREGGQLSPKVVIVIKVPTARGLEDGYREQMTTIGSGAAYIFQDGSVTEGTWAKPDKKTTMKFSGPDGSEIALNAGQTWITVIAPTKTVTWQ